MSEQEERILRLVGEQSSDLSVLLDEIERYLARFVVYPSENARIAHALWIAHTHCMDEWESTPRIAFLSPEPSSGKTRALELTETMVPNPIEAVNATPAYLFRKVSDPDGLPTILYDEIDTVFGPRAKDNEETRGMLNAGHRRGAMAGRCVTSCKIVTTEELPAFCAVVMAGLHDLPDTVLTRSVVIRMRRRAPTEKVEPYRRRIHGIVGNALRGRAEQWAKDYRLAGNYPTMPDGVEDRDADVWEPLIAIADAGGESWSKRARVAAVALVALSKESPPSLGVVLLTDLQAIFEGHDQLPTETILQLLHELDEAPWADLRGKPLDPRGLANYLRRYGVKSQTIRVGGGTPKGYKADDLWKSWERYVPSQARATSATTATNNTEIVHKRVADCIRCDGEGCKHCRTQQGYVNDGTSGVKSS